MKKVVMLVFFALIFSTNLWAQPNSSSYLIESVFSDYIEKTDNSYRVDSSFLSELISRAYPNNWQTPIKKNLDKYGYYIFGDYNFFLSKAYQEDSLAIGIGHYFNEEGDKMNFSIMFAIDESQENYYFIHFCQSGNKEPKWEFLGIDKVRCLNGNHSIISAGEKFGDLRSFY